jgi:hypothetical protein
MLVNLLVYIFINILFENNKAILGNYDPTISPINPTRVPVATICVHDTIEKDYSSIFMDSLNQSLLTVIQSFQLYIFVPSIIGTLIVINYSGKLVSKFYFNMKLLLTSYDENPP